MSTDETKVLVGGRRFRKIPPQTKVFVENEDTQQGFLRHRHATTNFVTSTPQNLPPSYGNPNYFTPPPKPQELYIHNDSGYYGTFNSPNQSYSNSESVANKSSLWETVSSPVLRMRNKFGRRGRPNFFEDERSHSWSVNPQQFLAWLVFVTILSSIGFAVLISLKHFSVEDESNSLNGKYQSLQFAVEKINAVGDENDSIQANADENARNPFFNEESEELPEPKVEVVTDSLFDVMNEIGQMSDLLLSEKIASEELGQKIKTSKIKIQKIRTAKTDEPQIRDFNSIDASVLDDLTEELLTPRPLPKLIVDHPTPTQYSVDKGTAKVRIETTKSNPSEKVIKTPVAEVVVNNDKEEASEEVSNSVKETSDDPQCCPHKPKEIKLEETIDLNPGIENISQPANISNSKKKSKHVNPLTKDVKVNKVSKAKLTENPEAELPNMDNVDYPDLPTFRGVHQPENQEQTEEVSSEGSDRKLNDATNDLDYPEDPPTFRRTNAEEI